MSLITKAFNAVQVTSGSIFLGGMLHCLFQKSDNLNAIKIVKIHMGVLSYSAFTYLASSSIFYLLRSYDDVDNIDYALSTTQFVSTSLFSALEYSNLDKAEVSRTKEIFRKVVNLVFLASNAFAFPLSLRNFALIANAP